MDHGRHPRSRRQDDSRHRREQRPGYETALALAGKGAQVLLACRDQAKGRAAEAQIRAAHPRATITLVPLDLASLADIRRCADALRAAHPRLDVLVNNAGVMALPYRKTPDGFEMQFGTNHLGHFALTGLLLDRLRVTPGTRVVTVSSTFHRAGTIRFDDPQWERGYSKWSAYGQSKVANLLFTYELQRKLTAAGDDVLSVAAHPGYAATNLQAAGPRMEGSSFAERFSEIGNRLFAQSAAMGALCRSSTPPSRRTCGEATMPGDERVGHQPFARPRLIRWPP